MPNSKFLPPSIERQELEDSWRLKLEDASTRYKVAHECYQKALEDQSRGLSGSGAGALSGARQEESQSLAEYTRVLKIFTDLTVDGKKPGAQPAETCEGVGKNSLITVVDDDESVRESLKGLLRSIGYQVQTFPSADSFLGSGSCEETECLILDLRMPGMDGYALQCRLNAESSRIPVIIITAHADEPARQRAIEAGALDVLHKPFAARVLLERVEKAVQKAAEWGTTLCRANEPICCNQPVRGREVHSRVGVEHPGESGDSTPVAVLIAEDEETVRTLAATALERAGFLVLPACNGEDAIEIFRNGGVNVDALLTDVQMGTGITGIALAERVLMERPGIAVLVMSGFPEAELLARERNLRFLAKPFTPAKLLEGMRQVLASNISAHSGNARKDEK